MRILIVHNSLNDSKSVSGVLRHYAWMANEFQRNGHPTDFLVARAGFPQLMELAPNARLISSDDIFDATRYLKQTWRYFPAFFWRMLRAHWLRLPERYDVIYASTQFIADIHAANVLARRNQAKFAAKVHHVLGAQHKRTGFFDRLFIVAERVATRILNRKADLVICGTDVVAADYKQLEARLRLPPSRTVSIGYGIEMATFAPAHENEKIYDGVVLGRMHEHKGIFDMAEIWGHVVKEMPGAKLLMIGEGPHRERATELFSGAGLAASVTFTGGIPEAAKNELLRKCRVGISPSYEEGWGLSVNEFLAAGIPVVGYHVPVFDAVFPEQLDLVEPGNKEAVATRITALLRNSEERQKRAERGREFVRRYDYRNVALAELAALKNLFA